MTNNPPSAQIKPGEYGFPLKLKARYDNFIGGEWVAPADGEYYQNLTPVTGQLLCEVASSGKRDIDLALDAAHKVKDKWAHTSVQDRAAILFKIADRMEQNLELLATAETWDNGKPIRETSAADVPLAIDHFRYFASCIRAQEGGISEVDSETVAYHFHEPLGVVGQIIPWNFPLLMASWKMAPALAAGNCVVLKPARLTPLSVLLLMEIVGDLLPPGVVNVVNGAGGEIGEYLANSLSKELWHLPSFPVPVLVRRVRVLCPDKPFLFRDILLYHILRRLRHSSGKVRRDVSQAMDILPLVRGYQR